MRSDEIYVGLPFVDGGRDFKGVDCWGLVRLFLSREAHIDVPSYGEISASDLIVSKTIRDESTKEPWADVADARRFDVLVMRGRPLHVGVMVDGHNVLHVEEASASVIVPVTMQMIANRKIKLCRHRKLCDEAYAA